MKQVNNPTIEIILYSYKAKNLDLVVESVINNTKNNFVLNIIDKSHINKSKTYKDIENINYTFIPWFYIASGSFDKQRVINDTNAKYLAIITDDTILKDEWDLDVINFINDQEIVLSGHGKNTLMQKNKFFFEIKTEELEDYSLSQIIDRNFIFTRSEILKKNQPRVELKYRGEQESLAMMLFGSGIDIYSTPTSIYEDLALDTMETTFTQFSIEHNYNMFINIVKGPGFVDNPKRSIKEYFDFHNLDRDNLYRLPYNPNDVAYESRGFGSSRDKDAGRDRLIAPINKIVR